MQECVAESLSALRLGVTGVRPVVAGLGRWGRSMGPTFGRAGGWWVAMCGGRSQGPVRKQIWSGTVHRGLRRLT